MPWIFIVGKGGARMQLYVLINEEHQDMYTPMLYFGARAAEEVECIIELLVRYFSASIAAACATM